jgi:NO-binding membrane sensor protein with MHYT domain
MDLHFDGSVATLGEALAEDYNIGLIFLSLIVICLSGYAMLGVMDRVRAAEKAGVRYTWLIAGTFTGGIGAWAMHFIGMLSLKLPIPVTYDIRLTILSILPACLNMVLTFYTSRKRRRAYILFFVSIGVAIGFAGMHFTGMLAMHGVQHELFMRYDPVILTVTAGIAFALVYVSLTMRQVLLGMNKEDRRNRRIILSIMLIQATAISGMHYSAMAATDYYQGNPISGNIPMALSPFDLALLVALGSFLVAALAIVVTVIDRRLQESAQLAQTSRAYMLEAIESIADGFALFGMDDRLIVCNQRYRELMDTGSGINPGMTFETIIRPGGGCRRPGSRMAQGTAGTPSHSARLFRGAMAGGSLAPDQ